MIKRILAALVLFSLLIFGAVILPGLVSGQEESLLGGPNYQVQREQLALIRQQILDEYARSDRNDVISQQAFNALVQLDAILISTYYNEAHPEAAAQVQEKQ